jgi:hypothetical protein
MKFFSPFFSCWAIPPYILCLWWGAEEILSLRLQLHESLTEECEAVEDVRPSRRVARISGFPLCRDGVFRCCSLDPRDRWPCVRLEGDSPMGRSARWLLGLAAGRGFVAAHRWWQRRVCWRLVSFSSPKWSGWWCVVSCRVHLFFVRGFVVWWCSLRRVMYQLLLFLKWHSSALLLFQKNMMRGHGKLVV